MRTCLSNEVGRHCAMKAHEVGTRHRDYIAETTVVDGIFHFSGKNIAAVDDARNMGDKNFSIRVCFADFIFT